MKVFGKKTLALVLTIAMALSLCSFTAFAGGAVSVEAGDTTTLQIENANTLTWNSLNPAVATVSQGVVTGVKPGTAKITATRDANESEGIAAVNEEWTVTVTEGTIASISADRETITVPYGTDKAGALAKLKSGITVTATNNHNKQFAVNGTWTIADTDWTGAVSDTGVTATVTYGGQTDTVTVKVGKANITSYTAIPDIEVPLGTMGNNVAAKFPKTVKVKFDDNSEKTLTVGEDLKISGSYGNDATTPTTYPFTVELSETGAQKYNKNCSITFNVKTVSSYKLNDITAVAVIEDDNDAVGNFKEDIRKLIENATGKTVSTSSIEFSWGSGVYGEISGSSYYIKSSKESDLHEAGRLNDSITYVAQYDGVSYSGSIKLTLYSPNVSKDFKKASGTLSDVATEISDRLKAYYGSSYGLDDIIFDNLDLEGGDLFTDSDCTEEVYEDESYTASQLAKMYYVPNGSGEVSEIEYTAYASSSRYISGTIYLSSDEFLVIQVEMNTGDTLQFSAEEFEEAFLNLKKSYESLKSVTFNSGVPNSKSAGYVYYDGETKIKSGTFFVEPSKTSEKAIDNLTYEAGTEGGVYSIDFTAKGTDERNKSVTVTGIYQITVRKAADLTIEAGVKESVSFDLDMFEEFYQENISKNYKNYDIVAVSFSGVPNSKEKGYLRNDGKSIKSPNDKKFYIDSDKEGDYAFEDLTFEGGSKASTTRAEFTVYAKKDGKGTAKTVTGTIDFIVGSTHSLSGSIKASETMKFAASLSAFEDLGGNDNVYVTFTGLPTGGKLVYNWGTGSQEDVKVGTEYYLSYKAGKKLLSNVTFVPSYSSSKQARTISIPVKAYNSKEKAVTGTINITVNYAAYSSKFTDITTSTYADSVDFLYNQGITTGMTATTFGPNSNVTRAQFVTFLYRAAGQPAVTGVTNKFTDVKSTGTYAYAYNAILWAVQNNITTGRSATKFDPAANVTHQELLTFLYRYDVNYLGHPGTQGSLSGFIDASSLQSYAVAPAKWAAYKGIIDGYTLQPAVAGSRATVALWLHRMLTL